MKIAQEVIMGIAAGNAIEDTTADARESAMEDVPKSKVKAISKIIHKSLYISRCQK